MVFGLVIELIKENYPMIIAFVITLLTGIGIGSAITDAINGWESENEKHMDEDRPTKQ